MTEADRDLQHRVSSANASRIRQREAANIGSITNSRRNRKHYAAGRLDLLAFAYTYFPHLMTRKPGPIIVQYANTLQKVVIDGECLSIAIPRGYAKTTIAKIGVIWAALYGHSDYSVIFGASQAAADMVLADIVYEFSHNDLLLRDFEAPCRCIRALEGQWQRAKTQHINGNNTDITLQSACLVLPTIVKSKRSKPEPSSNAAIVSRGITSGFLGLNYRGRRPRFCFLDDVQGLESSYSPSEIKHLEETVQGGVMALGGHETGIGILMACTIADENDLSSRYTDPALHPEFKSIRTGLVKSWSKNPDLWERYRTLWSMDQQNDSNRAREFYEENREAMDAGMSVLDQDLFNPRTEVSANQHAYHLLYRMGEKAFHSQIQNKPKKSDANYHLTTTECASRVNQTPRCTLPPGYHTVTIGCDINHDGIRVKALAAGPMGGLAVIDAFKFPARGVLVRKNATEREAQQKIYGGLVRAVEMAGERGYCLSTGKLAPIRGLSIDRGYMPEVVHLVVARTKARFPLVAIKGYDGRSYRPGNSTIGEPGYNCHMTTAKVGGQFLALNVDAAREYLQRGFLVEPLSPGSLSWFGSDPQAVYEYAENITAHSLASKAEGKYGAFYYHWNRRPGSRDDWADAAAYALGLLWHFRIATPSNAAMNETDQQTKPKRAAPPRRPPQQRKRKKPTRVSKIRLS